MIRRILKLTATAVHWKVAPSEVCTQDVCPNPTVIAMLVWPDSTQFRRLRPSLDVGEACVQALILDTFPRIPGIIEAQGSCPEKAAALPGCKEHWVQIVVHQGEFSSEGCNSRMLTLEVVCKWRGTHCDDVNIRRFSHQVCANQHCKTCSKTVTSEHNLIIRHCAHSFLDKVCRFFLVVVSSAVMTAPWWKV